MYPICLHIVRLKCNTAECLWDVKPKIIPEQNKGIKITTTKKKITDF